MHPFSFFHFWLNYPLVGIFILHEFRGQVLKPNVEAQVSDPDLDPTGNQPVWFVCHVCLLCFTTFSFNADVRRSYLTFGKHWTGGETWPCLKTPSCKCSEAWGAGRGFGVQPKDIVSCRQACFWCLRHMCPINRTRVLVFLLVSFANATVPLYWFLEVKY